MADEVKIDKELFHHRLNQLVSAWKSDKRSGNDALFEGVSSIVIVLGKNEDAPSYQKSNALHVSHCMLRMRDVDADRQQSWLLGYEFPSTLMVFTVDSLYVVTTPKKGM